jgi:phage FluMu gp28-like protein
MTKLPSLGVNLWKFQKNYLADNNRFIGVCWARGNGKSRITALKIALDVFDAEAQQGSRNWLIVSATSAQAQEALRLAEGWSRVIFGMAVALKIITEEVEYRTEDGLARYTRFRLRLGKNSQVIALSASPEAIRGYSSSVFWDEAAFFADSEKMWAALQHVTRGKYKMIVASTPQGGSENKYHQIMHNKAIVRGKPLWSHHWADIHRAIADGRVYDLESEKAASDPFSWRSEMLLQFLDSAATWFSQELIASCEDSRASAIGHGYQRGKCFIGNDIGLRGDKWAAVVIEATPGFGQHYEEVNGQKICYYSGELMMRELVVLDRSTFAEHDRQIARLFAKYDVTRLCSDQGGMGERSVEEYYRLYGSRAEGVLFNVENKGHMATLALELMTEGRVLLPEDRPDIGLDLRKIQRVVSAGGAVRFNAQRDSNGHADIAWAYMLALNAAALPYQEIAYEDGGVRDSWTEMESFTY